MNTIKALAFSLVVTGATVAAILAMLNLDHADHCRRFPQVSSCQAVR